MRSPASLAEHAVAQRQDAGPVRPRGAARRARWRPVGPLFRAESLSAACARSGVSTLPERSRSGLGHRAAPQHRRTAPPNARPAGGGCGQTHPARPRTTQRPATPGPGQHSRCLILHSAGFRLDDRCPYPSWIVAGCQVWLVMLPGAWFARVVTRIPRSGPRDYAFWPGLRGTEGADGAGSGP
jgi:hypothetical protein